MITPIALGAVKRYVAKDDKENPTTWLLGSIDSIAKTKILSESISVNMDDLDNPKINANINPLEQDLLIVRMGLKGYENFSVPYKTEKLKIGTMEIDVLAEEILKAIPRNIISELSGVIWGENTVTEKERKN